MQTANSKERRGSSKTDNGGMEHRRKGRIKWHGKEKEEKNGARYPCQCVRICAIARVSVHIYIYLYGSIVCVRVRRLIYY